MQREYGKRSRTILRTLTRERLTLAPVVWSSSSTSVLCLPLRTASSLSVRLRSAPLRLPSPSSLLRSRPLSRRFVAPSHRRDALGSVIGREIKTLGEKLLVGHTRTYPLGPQPNVRLYGSLSRRSTGETRKNRRSILVAHLAHIGVSRGSHGVNFAGRENKAPRVVAPSRRGAARRCFLSAFPIFISI